MFIAALFIVGKGWKQPKCLLTDEWIFLYLRQILTHTHTHTHTNILQT